MKRLLALPIAALLCSCASTTHVTTFKPPSLAPVTQSVARIEKSVQGAQSAAKRLEAATDEASKDDKAWRAAYVELTTELDNAYLQIQATKDEVKAKQTEIDDLTKSANELTEQLANERDAQKAKADAEYHEKMAWMKRFYYAVGALALAAIWIFKKPILMALEGSFI